MATSHSYAKMPRIPFSEGHEYEWVKVTNSDSFNVHADYRTDWKRGRKRRFRLTPDVSCRPSYTQIYQPPLTLSGVGRIVNIKTGGFCGCNELCG